MNNKMIRSFYSILFVLSNFIVFSQEGVRPLSSNLNYIYKDLKPKLSVRPNDVSHHKAQAVSLSIPFTEDFHYSPTSNYPDPNKWSDSSVYVNSGFAIAPPSIGAATFDGLNKHGYPYDPYLTNQTLSNPADSLTSQPINLFLAANSQTLDPTTNVALSFYYQARGNGDNPEINDSLVVDFFKPKQNVWKSGVWFKSGNASSNVNDTVFKRAFIRILDTAYFHDGFKFRFRNWASSTGNFDHWNVDYIFLDQGRADSLYDTVRYDISLTGVPTPFLRDYSAMPYQQYNSSEMATNLAVRIRNSYIQPINMNYKYGVYNPAGTLLAPEYDGGPDNINPFIITTFSSQGGYGYSHVIKHAAPAVTDITFPVTPDSADYMIKHYIFMTGNATVTTSDARKENDTVVQYQRFRNYYAFDDGSAEGGYYVNAIGAKIAVKINVNNPDTLRALRIYFDPVGKVGVSSGPNSDYNFYIRIWGLDSNGGPLATPIYSESIAQTVDYIKTGFKEIPEFKLKAPLFLNPGTYFIGIQQTTHTLAVGFDKNYDHRTSLYYNSGSGWTQSAEAGSIMIRPVFGKYIPPPVGINEFSYSEKNPFLIYPNPSSEQFTIVSPEGENNSYQLFNSMGQLVKEDRLESSLHDVSTSTLSTGIYILILKTKGQTVQQQKLIIQH